MASGFPGRTPTPRLLLREGLKPNNLLPSKFQRENFVNSKQEASTGGSFLPRIGPCVDMSETRQKLSPAPPKRSVFGVSPRELVFQNVVAHEVSEMVLSIMNKDKIARMVKVSMESSPYFQLACPSDVYHIVPPGASAPVRIRFTPDENKDYSHELTCITAKEKIVVPIRAIGARAILDFPDQLDFSECPVKHSTQKTLLVRNVGNRTAHYQLSTQSPFSVVPTAGTLGAGDTMQVTVTFHALTNGEHFGSLSCNTGEESIHTKLHGEAVDVDVVLSTNSVEAGKTFITMAYQTTVFLENRSNITAHFQWKALPSEGEENKEKRRQCRLLHPSGEEWLENFMEEKEVEKVQGFSEDHTALLRSRVQEKKAKVQDDPLLFSSDIFFIEPLEGEIGPNSTAEITVTFKPLEALEYQSVAYCHVSGREIRLPLCLRGKGQGPLVELSSPTLNLGNVFVYTPYVYKVELINKGALDAPFTYIPSTTNVDFCFMVEPERGMIAPGGTQTVQISFHTTVLGSFEEKFQFSVAETPTPVILTIRGSVTGPNLHFDLPELDFGDISFGFPCTKSIRLTNCSMVPVTFKLRMSDDGTQPAVSSFDQIRKEGDPSWRKGIHFYVEPREFTMNPSQGTILPQGHQDVEVTLCSNTVMRYKQRLLVDLEGIAEEVASVVITARCLVPELNVYPQILLYHECHLKVPYERKLFIRNLSNLPGCYGLIPQKRKDDSPVLYSSPKPCGIVQPYGTAEIPVIIEVQTLGEHRTKALVGVFGDERNPRGVELQSSGRLAEIYPSPTVLEFGSIPALQPASQSFTLFNKGLVPVDFSIEMASKSNCFVIEPSEGAIPARGEVPVTVTATLDDTVGFDDTVQLFIGNSLWSSVFLQAFGIGTTIVTDKPFAPELNLGYQFSLVPCIHQFKVTNKGRRYHQLFWSVECYSPPEEGSQSVSTLSSPRAKDDSQCPKRASPVFGLEPLSMDLQPGQSEDMVLRGFSHIPQEVQDYVFCEAIIGTSPKMERIIETIITCQFIHPSIEVSARQFSFYVEKKPSDVLTLQYQPLSLKNTCLLPLDLMLHLEQPFLVCDKKQQPLPGGQPVRVDVGETCHLYIVFDPAYELDFKSWRKEKVLKIDMVRGHPFVEHISLEGEVHFPNLQMEPSSVEFGFIRPDTEEVRSLEMTNCSPLPVQYRWSFRSDSKVTRFRDELCPPKFKPQPPKGKKTSLESPASRWRHFKMRQEQAARMLKEVDDFTQSLRDKVQSDQLPEYPRHQVGFEGFSISVDEPQTSLEAEEAFSILPMSGVLQPGESQQVSFTYSGHLNTISDVTALCHVEGGPTYEVLVTGEISHFSYLVRPQEINCGLQIFNEIHHSDVTLVNGGKIEFNWVLKPSPADKCLPGVFLVNPTTLTPSAFQKEMSLSTKQRLARAKKLRLPQAVQPQDKPGTSHHKFSAADPEQSSIQPCPPEVVFQNYSPSEVCEVPLVLRNRDKVPHLVKVTMKSSPYFQLVGPNDACRKVPPGLYMTVRILFTPGQKKDYFHQLLCTTEREEFIVPIRAIGARAILDFPDQLDFSECPVKHSTQKTLLVRNVGNRTAHYQLSTQSPFSVIPTMGALDVGDAVQVAVEFQPLKTGDHSGSLVVHYDTGEDTHTSLHARAVDAHIGLDRNTVTLEKTYISMSNSATVLIHNRSDITARFQWKAVATEEQEDQLRLRRYHGIYQQQRQKLYGFLKEREVDITCQERLALLNHTFQSKVAKIRGDPMLLDNDIFSLRPKEGEIRPNCSAEISVFFTPQAAQVYERTVYCDISGRENRLPLLLTGEGLGPRVHFHFEELNIGEVFVRVTHRYEAYLINNGPIEALFKLIPPTTAMGSCFTFLPQEGIVAPEKLQVIRVSFCPTIRGEFEEEFCFHVTESPKPLTFTVRGSVMGPTFHFDVPALHFGDVAFGFPHTLKCCLFNTSLTPMDFFLHVPGDGLGVPSVDSSTQTGKPSSQSQRREVQVLRRPREFTISPCSGTVRALGSQDIKVTLCPNTAGEYKLELVLDAEDVGRKAFALPLTARCIVPPLGVLNPVLELGHCCLKVFYDEKVTLVNDSDFPGSYCLLPQEHKEVAAVWYSSPAPAGIIEAHSSVEIPIALEAQLLGQCNITAKLAVFGRESPLEIRLECVCQGPVVAVHPREINFGSIPVLEDRSKTLHLANQCEIPATFQVEMAGKRSCWRIEPSKGVVPPNSEVSVAVIANLNDTVKFQEKVKVFIQNNPVTIISLQAVGIGTTVVTDKTLVPKLDLKSCFSFSPCFYHFQLTNRGRRTQRLYWSTEGFRTFRRGSRAPARAGTKGRGAPPIPRPGSPVFKVWPVQVDLRPGQTVDMVLEGCSSTVQEVKERLLCHAAVGKEITKKQILQVDVICNFICPGVQMSPRAIAFRVEKKPSDALTLQYQLLTLKNTSSLPFSIVLDLEQPFLVCNVNQKPLPANSKPVRVDVGKELHLYIRFNPAYKNSKISWVVKKVLRVSFMEHPHVEKVPVRGEVYFPNLHLPTKAVDFGCIINDTEQVLHMRMTNCSPLPVNYHWSFLTDSQVNTIRFIPSPPKFKPQSPKKKGVFPWRYSRTESVEELTETPETMQDSAQENSAQENSAQENSVLEDSFLEDFDEEDPAQEDSAQEDSAQEDSDQEPADAEHSLETEGLSSTPGASQRPVRMRGLSWFSEMEHPKLGMQEVFDVRPLWGELQPGESEQVTFTFFGHANIVARVRALCHVQGGPTYEVVLAGEASCPSYQLDVEEIDWGLQVFNKVLKAQVTLWNTGVMEFTYVVPSSSTGTAAKPLPGVPVVVPNAGFLAPGQKQVFKVYYLPGKLGVFHKTFQVHVAHLEPAEIILKGKGTFPGVTKYRPRMLKEEEEILQEEEKNPEEEEKEKDESAVTICGDGVTDAVTGCQS